MAAPASVPTPFDWAGISRVVFLGMLEQRSALSVGGSDHESTLDDPFCLDGLYRPTLRGSGLAGAFFAALRKCGVDIPLAFTGTDQRIYDESVLRFWNSHPEECWHRDTRAISMLEPRQGVGIRHDTGAAKDGALYDMQALAAGHQWPLVIELDLARWRQRAGAQDAEPALALVRLGLHEWEQGRCWIGRGVARGLGWMNLRQLAMVACDEATGHRWQWAALHTNRTRNAFDAFCRLAKAQGVVDPPVQTRSAGLHPWRFVRITGTLSAGERQDGQGMVWGIDSLSLGGHDAGVVNSGSGAFVAGNTYDPLRLLSANSSSPTEYQKEFSPDFALAMTCKAKGKWEPFIPGSAIRGPLRHRLSHDWRAAGKPVRDPLTGCSFGAATPDVDDGERYFGGPLTRRKTPSSRLLVRDACLVAGDGKPWTMLLEQLHAEDEFTAGAYSDAKFDRMALMQGTFEWQIVIEVPPPTQQDETPPASRTEGRESETAANAAGSPLQPLAANGMALEVFKVLRSFGGHGLALGGGQWRGHGWVCWEVKRGHVAPTDAAEVELIEVADAGDKWQTIKAPS